MTNPAFSLNEDGSATDPAAFRAALKADSERVKKLQVRASPGVAVPVPPRRPPPPPQLPPHSARQARCSCAGGTLSRSATAQRRRSSCCDDSTALQSSRVSHAPPARTAHARRTPSWRTRSWRLSWTPCRRRCARCAQNGGEAGGPEAVGLTLVSKLREASTQMSELDTAMLMNSMDRMRARCTTPRDVVAVYQALNKVRNSERDAPVAPSARTRRLACNTGPPSAC